MDLDAVLNEEPQEEPQVVEAPQAPDGVAPRGERQQLARNKEREAQEAGKEPAVEAKVEPPKVEPKVEPPKQEMSDKERALLSAATDERNKRQAIEKRYQELEARVNAQPKEPEKTFYEDPDAKMKAWQDQQAEFQAQMRNMLVTAKIDTAEQIARSKYPDFEEKAQAFVQLVNQTPGLWQQAIASGNPAEYAYKTAKNHIDLQAAGNIDSLKANMEKELRLKIETEFKEKQEAEKKERDSIPPSLSQARGTNQHRPVWNGPPPLDNILSD